MRFLLVCALYMVTSVSGGELKPPRTFILNSEILVHNQARALANDPALGPALKKLQADADKALGAGPFSVTNKTKTPPSGDKHDYMSIGPYFWPNPKTADGLPYIRKDGEVNPERVTNAYDSVRLNDMTETTATLCSAWYFTADEKYANRAALLLRTWFLDAATKMNPNLKYGQAIPGVTEGRGIGIIDTKDLAELVDYIGLLEESKALSEQDRAGLKAWYAEYLNWLRTHKYGIDERNTKNNHGTFYDMQVAVIAFFVGEDALAKQFIEDAKKARIDPQIETSGAMPDELARTKSFDYSLFNLRAFFNLAAMGERCGVDLWNYTSRDGGSIRKAMDFMLPYADPKTEWPYKQITPREKASRNFAILLRRASLLWKDAKYEQALEKLGLDQLASDRLQLLYSK